jgi:acetyl esterase/lipase
MKRVPFLFLGILCVVGCGQPSVPAPGNAGTNPAGVRPDPSKTLAEARRGFQTKLVIEESDGHPIPAPPPQTFRLVRYESPAGKLGAYLTPDPKDGKKHPAILWITGGDCNTIDNSVFKDGPPNNDQTAAAYRKAGIIMMFPTLRGGNDNPGVREGFFGEIDDVLAAAAFAAQQPYIDPQRIYLGGHSTGGTLVLLTAEYADRFRAVFSFGPADDVRGYPGQFAPFDKKDSREVDLRSPALWLHGIKSPTFVFEGTIQGNLDSLQRMAQSSTNPQAHFFPVEGANHFSILAPTNRLIAERILRDTGPTCTIAFTKEELSRPFGR